MQTGLARLEEFFLRDSIWADMKMVLYVWLTNKRVELETGLKLTPEEMNFLRGNIGMLRECLESLASDLIEAKKLQLEPDEEDEDE